MHYTVETSNFRYVPSIRVRFNCVNKLKPITPLYKYTEYTVTTSNTIVIFHQVTIKYSAAYVKVNEMPRFKPIMKLNFTLILSLSKPKRIVYFHKIPFQAAVSKHVLCNQFIVKLSGRRTCTIRWQQ